MWSTRSAVSNLGSEARFIVDKVQPVMVQSDRELRGHSRHVQVVFGILNQLGEEM